jgi:hypothetical protein
MGLISFVKSTAAAAVASNGITANAVVEKMRTFNFIRDLESSP